MAAPESRAANRWKIEIGVRQRHTSGHISYFCAVSAPARAGLESIPGCPAGKHRAARDGTRIDSCRQCIVRIWHFGLASSQAVVPFCLQGFRQRSHAARLRTLTSMAMRRASSGRRIQDVNPLLKQYWSRKKCPYINCPECLRDNDVKQKCYEDALDLFKKQWQACARL